MLFYKGFQGRSSSFRSGEVPHFAVSPPFLLVDTHDNDLLRLLDALMTHSLVAEQGSAHLGQPNRGG